MNEILVAGHICLDIIPSLRAAVKLEPGRLIEVGQATISTGGAVSNTGQALHRLGVSTSLLGKVGDDLFGKAICHVLEGNGTGLSHGMIVSKEDPTSYTIVISLDSHDRTFLHAPGCNNTFTDMDVSDEALMNARLIHFGYPTLMAKMFEDDGRSLAALFRRAKQLGATTSLDVSLPDLASKAGKANWESILKRVLPFTDLFLPSIDEILFMLDRPNFESFGGSEIPVHEFERLAGRAFQCGAKVVAIKAGQRGLFLKTQSRLDDLGRGEPENLVQWENRTLWAPAYEVEVQGTTGAGDATIAGLLMGWIRSMEPEIALQGAVAVGACCCEKPDAVTGIKSWEETQDRIASGWQDEELSLPLDWEFAKGVFGKVG